MKLTSAFRTQKSQDWKTPEALFLELDKEFNFDCDPCPLFGKEMFSEIEWGQSNWVNPPYNQLVFWLNRGYEEFLAGKTCVFLVPSRTGSAWFHEYANKATELRFIRGRLQFNNCGINAPFDSLIMIFRGNNARMVDRSSEE